MKKQITPINTTNIDKTEAPTVAALPVLSPDQKIVTLTLQRNAVIVQNQKQAADAAFEKAMQELNAHYQNLINQNPDFNFNADTLTFVSKQ
jgi:hypothetical protein